MKVSMRIWLRAVIWIYVIPLLIAALGILVARLSTSNNGWTALGYFAFSLLAAGIWLALAALLNLMIGVHREETSRVWLSAIALAICLCGWIAHLLVP